VAFPAREYQDTYADRMDLSEVERRHRALKSAKPERRQRTVRFAAMRIVLAFVLLVGAYFVLPFDRVSVAQLWFIVFTAVAALTVVSIVQLRAVASSEFPTLRGVEALMVSLVLLLVSFAGIYIGLSSYDAGAFDEQLDHVGALYFALTTLTTIGYGDISPVSNAARIVVMVQMVVDVVILGVFIRLVINAVRSRLETGPDSTDPIDPDRSASVG
jgi:voltage-gated potassium channel